MPSEKILFDVFINFYGQVLPRTVAVLNEKLLFYTKSLYRQQGQENKPVKVKNIHILINSPGGIQELANSAFDITKALKKDYKIITYNVGVVDSAAVALFCMGDERKALPNSRFIIHESTLQFQGELKRAKESVDCANDAANNYAGIVSEVCKKDLEIIKNDIAKHKCLYSEDAIEYGLATEEIKLLPQIQELDDIFSIVE